MRAALMRGQKSVEELVDLYPIRNQAVRGVLIDYFTRRRADTDYATLKNLVLHLAHHFWEKIERLNPDQADLRISPEIYTAWRQMIAVKVNGAPRAGADSLVISVRSFYFGEIEGIDLTLTFLRAKRDETQRRAQRPAVHLGLPARRRPQESE
ncbi:hypothetical protein [Streptomyces swartbergensis]|uniref:hypothetical protein n=1 Tax=Streptomyces swartbergensis TaxID=487165 RepID=UPI00142E664E|nr:hypothetical protein [Streptomyces swartbergensis]